MVANKHKCIIKNKMSSIFQLIVRFEQSIEVFPLFQLIDVSIPDENYLCSVFQMVAHGHNTFIESTCFNDGSFQLVFMKFRRAIHQGIQAKLHQTIQVKFHQVIQVKLHQITPATIRSDSFKLIDMLASEEAREPWSKSESREPKARAESRELRARAKCQESQITSFMHCSRNFDILIHCINFYCQLSFGCWF